MRLSNFSIVNFRNITQAQLDLSPSYNLFWGSNGSGKTSLLEAIYYLALGKSFRSHLIRRIVKHAHPNFTLFGKIQSTPNLSSITVGIERSITAGKQIKIAGQETSSLLEITQALPLQLLNQSSFTLLEQGPKARRQFIDWGLFHLKPTFFPLWQKTERVLEQRNMLLRNNSDLTQLASWDASLARYGFLLHQQRTAYVTQLEPLAEKVLAQLLPEHKVELVYYPGWNINTDLVTILQQKSRADQQVGYTTVGPHRADIQITINKVPAKDALSRGQQKLLVYGLKIAQILLLHSQTNKTSLLLIDDLSSELDQRKQQLLLANVASLPVQIFLTQLDQKPMAAIFSEANSQTFHVEQGIVTI